jgi:hypothetical protein
MSTLYKKQDDGTLKPIECPEQLVKTVAIYEWLREKGFTLDEIQFLVTCPFAY